MVVMKIKKMAAVMIKRVEPLLIRGLNAYITVILATLEKGELRFSVTRNLGEFTAKCPDVVLLRSTFSVII